MSIFLSRGHVFDMSSSLAYSFEIRLWEVWAPATSPAVLFATVWIIMLCCFTSRSLLPHMYSLLIGGPPVYLFGPSRYLSLERERVPTPQFPCHRKRLFDSCYSDHNLRKYWVSHSHEARLFHWRTCLTAFPGVFIVPWPPAHRPTTALVCANFTAQRALLPLLINNHSSVVQQCRTIWCSTMDFLYNVRRSTMIYNFIYNLNFGQKWSLVEKCQFYCSWSTIWSFFIVERPPFL